MSVDLDPISLAAGRRGIGGPLRLHDLSERWLLRQLQALGCGELRLRLPGGNEQIFTGPQAGPSADMTVARARLYRRILIGGDLGFAEAYMDGDWQTGDLVGLLSLAAANEQRLGAAASGQLWKRLAVRLAHILRPNSQQGSKRNIAQHYDLGNAFYGTWLDRTMTYSAAIFERQDDDLAAAQINKFRRLAHLAQVKPGDRLLEIGCGWGGFAVWAARELDCQVTAITISRAQHDFTEERIRQLGLADRVCVRLQDYRSLRGHYDAIVSIEMLEAVGERFWPGYFDRLKACLKPGGRAALQVITINDAFFGAYRQNADFIQRYIFPGGFLPSVAALADPLRRSGLRLVANDGYGRHYDRTLDLWHDRFQQAWPEIAKLGFDERFARMWRYYFAYCQAGFRTGRIDLRQIALQG